MSDVFVSYKAEDRRRVEPLVHALEADGLSVWWDAQIAGGDRWRASILKNLEAAACCIVVWSKRSTGPDGEFVCDEASRAKRLGTYLPVRIDKVEPPLGFGEMQALSLQGWKGDRGDARFQSVLAAVRTHIGVLAPVSTGASPAFGRRAVVAGGTAAILSVGAAAGAWWHWKPAAASNSIAVLPFANLSGDPAQAYFSDGIAEELRSALSRISGLKVVARTSSEAVRDEDAKTAAHKLDVGNILTGSVRRSPSLVRISAQLIDARDGTEHWSQDYDRPTGDTLQIQSDIAQRVAAALAFQLVPGAGGRLVPGGTTNAQAYDFFLKGLATRQGAHRAENLNNAIKLFDSAIRLDPGYADAYARKATAVSELSVGFSRSEVELERGSSNAAALAERALALAPTLPSAHAALAAVAAAQLDFARALAEFRKAVSANGSDAAILGDYGRFLGQLGLADQAFPVGERLIALDPLSGRSYSVPMVASFYSRRYANAVTFGKRVLTLLPGAGPALTETGDSLALLGKHAEARAIYAQAAPDDVFRITGEGILDERLGNHAASAGALQTIVRIYGAAASYQLAQLHAQRGELDEAFAALERGLRVRDSGLVTLLVDPFLDPIRTDPRFRQFCSKINFPPEIRA
jgi:serine/threonine-protein kinase